MLLPRPHDEKNIKDAIERSPAVALIGPRRCGKSTLAGVIAKQLTGTVHRFDFEDSRTIEAFRNPYFVLENLTGLIVLDEIQRRPELFPALRVLIDQKKDRRFLIIGSASPDLLRQSTESLAGRIAYVELPGFTTETIAPEHHRTLHLRGGYPESFLAKNDAESVVWRNDLVKTILERDLPQSGFRVPSQTMRRFLTMLAHNHGHPFNASDLGRNFGASYHTMRHHLDILSGILLIRQLQPWFMNTRKRLIKTPKAYLRDSGILHALLGVKVEEDLLGHSIVGMSFEGFVIEQAAAILALREHECFFWALQSGAEVDLVFQSRGKLFGIEAKFSDAPAITRSMHTAIESIPLEHLFVVHPGEGTYPAHEKITVTGLQNLRSALTERRVLSSTSQKS